MKNRVEEQMAGMLDSVSLNDILPDFDKEAVWEKVSARIPAGKPVRKILPVRIWQAAAVLLVIVSTYMFMTHKGSVTEPTVATAGKKIPQAAPQTTTANSTIAVQQPTVIVKPANGTAQTAINATQQPVVVTPSIVVHEPVAPQEPLVATDPVLPKQPSVAAAPAKRVVHYMDIDDEAVSSTEKHIASSPFIQVKLKKPEISNDEAQKKPFKELMVALGQ